MESMRAVDRVMEREIKKGSTPLKFEQLGFGDYSYNEITSKEKLLQVFFVKHFSLKKASEFPVFSKGFSLL